jgi:hypothetical protein
VCLSLLGLHAQPAQGRWVSGGDEPPDAPGLLTRWSFAAMVAMALIWRYGGRESQLGNSALTPLSAPGPLGDAKTIVHPATMAYRDRPDERALAPAPTPRKASCVILQMNIHPAQCLSAECQLYDVKYSSKARGRCGMSDLCVSAWVGLLPFLPLRRRDRITRPRHSEVALSCTYPCPEETPLGPCAQSSTFPRRNRARS